MDASIHHRRANIRSWTHWAAEQLVSLILQSDVITPLQKKRVQPGDVIKRATVKPQMVENDKKNQKTWWKYGSSSLPQFLVAFNVSIAHTQTIPQLLHLSQA